MGGNGERGSPGKKRKEGIKLTCSIDIILHIHNTAGLIFYWDQTL